jgi:GNAT superfamily N-acetyltransferase
MQQSRRAANQLISGWGRWHYGGVLVERTVSYLEMTSFDKLVPSRPPPAPIEMERVGPASAALLASTYTRIGMPHHWTSLPEARWKEGLARPGAAAWIARVRGEVAGMVATRALGRDVEIVVAGLVPEFVGKGFGGHLLAVATRLAWNVEHPDGGLTKRVWLHTSSLDHPNALPNYQQRGFEVFATEKEQKEMPE